MKEPEKGKGELSKIREKPGESSAFSYKTKGPFAGPDKTFPINTEKRARNALSRAHFAKNPESVKSKVYSEYPGLKKRHEERAENDQRYKAYKSK
jgi:hypothetical protein